MKPALVLLSLLWFFTISYQPKKVAENNSDGFPYRNVPRSKPDVPLSKAINRVYEGNYGSWEVATNELFSSFKYTPLKSFYYHGGDGTLSRRDATKAIYANGEYYVCIPEAKHLRHQCEIRRRYHPEINF